MCTVQMVVALNYLPGLLVRMRGICRDDLRLVRALMLVGGGVHEMKDGCQRKKRNNSNNFNGGLHHDLGIHLMPDTRSSAAAARFHLNEI